MCSIASSPDKENNCFGENEILYKTKYLIGSITSSVKDVDISEMEGNILRKLTTLNPEIKSPDTNFDIQPIGEKFELSLLNKTRHPGQKPNDQKCLDLPQCMA